MDRSECPAPAAASVETQDIAKRLLQMVNETAGISWWDKSNWAIGIALSVGGIVAAPFSGGASLALTVLGIIWVCVDMIKKIRETSTDGSTRRETSRMEKRVNFLLWCLEGRS